MATSFNKYYASWKNEIPKKVYDNISRKSPTFMMLMQKKKSWDSGGDTIQPHIKYKQATNAGSYRGYDTLDITPQDTRTDAEFRRKQEYASITINGYERLSSKGPNAIFSMMDIAMTDAEDALFDKMATQIFGNGTGNNGKDILGLAAAIDDGSNVATYAGIDRSTSGWWKAIYNGSTGPISIPKLRTAFRQASRGGIKNSPDFMVCGGDSWDYVSALTDALLQFNIPVNNAGKMFGQMGFPYINLFGVPLVYDEYCPDDELYMLNTETVQLWTDPGANFTPTEMTKPANMDARVGQLLWSGELICTEPRANVHLKGIQAPA